MVGRVHRINQLPVVVNGKVVGIVTDRDLRDAYPSVFEDAWTKSGHEKRDNAPEPEKLLIESIMSGNIITIAPADSVTDAAAVLRKERVGALPVVSDGKLVGILARSDLIDALVAIATGQGSPRKGGK